MLVAACQLGELSPVPPLRMNPTPRWFWPVVFLPLAVAIAMVTLHLYDLAHFPGLRRWTRQEDVGMALALYLAFVLLAYLLLLSSWRRGGRPGETDNPSPKPPSADPHDRYR